LSLKNNLNRDRTHRFVKSLVVSSSSDVKPFSLHPVIPLLVLAAINLGAPFIPIPNMAAAVIGGIVLTAAYVAAAVAFALGIARRELSIPVALGFFVLCVLAWVGAEYGMRPYLREFGMALRQAGGAPTLWQQLTFLYVSTIQDLALISVASFAGAMLARGIRYPNMLGPIGAIIALIDIWGVLFGGIVSQMLANKATQPLAARAMTNGPQIGAAHEAATGFSLPLPSIGIGDFLFISLLLCALVNLKMNWRTAAWLMGVFVTLALVAITRLPWVPALPGLLFIGAGAVLPNFKYFSYTRDERFALMWAGLLVIVLTFVLYLGFKSALPPQPANQSPNAGRSEAPAGAPPAPRGAPVLPAS
jgi:hypothetical protein